ncbi:hypothetical protein [Streptomyces sp. NPDC054975]
MYLVHIHLRPPADGPPLPRDTDRLVAGSAVAADGFELAVAHPRVRPHPVVGVYLRARSLEAAEECAGSIWRRAVARHPQLRAWIPVRAEVPLLMPGADG